MSPRIKTKIWIQAQLRLCDQAFIPFVVIKKGDPDAGVVLLKVQQADGHYRVFSQTRTMDGDPAWRAASGTEPISETEADSYIARQQKYDSDLWVVEVEDQAGRYELDADVID